MNRRSPIIDMRPDGTFREATHTTGTMLLTTKIALGAMVVAVAGAGLLAAAVIAWFVSLILPAIIVAGGVAYVAWKLRGWQLRRGPAGGGPVRRL